MKSRMMGIELGTWQKRNSEETISVQFHKTEQLHRVLQKTSFQLRTTSTSFAGVCECSCGQKKKKKKDMINWEEFWAGVEILFIFSLIGSKGIVRNMPSEAPQCYYTSFYLIFKAPICLVLLYKNYVHI